MELGLLILRVVIGVLLVGHGTQKLFGWYGGHGLSGTAAFFESIGLRPGRFHARAAGFNEAAGGALLAFGLLTPLAATLIIATMVAAIVTVHAKNGVWATQSGYEYNLVLVAAAFALACTGAGTLSLDHALGLSIAGSGWGIAALAAGVLGGVGAVLQGRSASHESSGPAHPTGA
jgi:putative oxidoreductase